MAVVFYSETLPLYWSLLQQYRHCHSSSFRSFVYVTVCQRPTLFFDFNRSFFMHWRPNRENVQRFESRLLELVIRYRDSLSLYTWCWAPQWTWNCDEVSFLILAVRAVNTEWPFWKKKNTQVNGWRIQIFNLICCFEHMWNCTSFLFRPTHPVFFKLCLFVHQYCSQCDR